MIETLAVTTRALTDRQKDVLAWIVAGCPARDWPDDSHKLSARALASRRLATVTRPGGAWTATATAAGRFYAEHGRYPDGHWKTPDPAAPKPRPKATKRSAARQRQAPSPEDFERQHARQMMAWLRGGQNPLDMGSSWSEETRDTVRIIKEMGLLKPGERLHVERGRVTLLPPGTPEDETVARVRTVDIACPERLSPRPHKAVTALRTSGHLADVSPDTTRRLLRCVQALVNAAVTEGHAASADSEGLAFRIGTQTVRLRFDEPKDRSDHVKTKEEITRVARGYDWSPRYDYTPSGRIRIRGNIGEQVEARPTTKASNPWRWEARLNDLYDRVLEAAAVSARYQREEEAREEARRQQYAADLITARVTWIEHKRAEAFEAQVDAWYASERLRRYVEAMRERAAGLEGAERVAADEWVTWAEQRLEGLDPLTVPPAAPVLSEPTEGQLSQFVPRRSRW